MESPKQKKAQSLQRYSTILILISFVGLVLSAIVIYLFTSSLWGQRMGWGILVVSMLCYGAGRVLQILVRTRKKSVGSGGTVESMESVDSSTKDIAK